MGFVGHAARFIVFCSVVMSVTVKAGELRVYAAASLTDALNQITRVYEQTHPTIKIKTAFGGTATLAKQIEQGAPADMFIAADSEWMRYLIDRKQLRADSLRNLAGNELVIIAPAQAGVGAIDFSAPNPLDRLQKGRVCTGEPASVPVGKYAKQALSYYGVWSGLAKQLVTADDVRTALAFVERNECDWGIVYRTDALASQKVKMLGVFPMEAYSAIVYPMALTNQASPEAQEFWKFLQSEQVKNLLSQFGFRILNS